MRESYHTTIAQRDAVIADFLKTGDSEPEIAKRHSLSVGQVNLILNRYWNTRKNAIVQNAIKSDY